MLADRLAKRMSEMGEPLDYTRLAREVLGIAGASDALARRLVEKALVPGDRHEVWRRAGVRICHDAPSGPGVYVLRDEDGAALYVGKSVNIRRRLRAHFASRRWLMTKPALARTTNAEWHEVGSEIEALLVEATLINGLKPTVNVQVGLPTLTRRAISPSQIADVVLIVPSVDQGSVQAIGAQPTGRALMVALTKEDASLHACADRLWTFFNSSAKDVSGETPFGALVYSWLQRRGADTTRLDPRDTCSLHAFRDRLRSVRDDAHLFTGRLVHYWKG
jgi:predicted GIY-YIG superfamily endonuclease